MGLIARVNMFRLVEPTAVEIDMDTFAIRAFINGKRKPTHEMTKKEARVFRNAARALDRYLTRAYKLGK